MILFNIIIFILKPEIYRNDIKSMFVVNDMHDVLDFEDLLFMSHPVSAPRNLRESFDKISYKKGKLQYKINLPIFNTFI